MHAEKSTSSLEVLRVYTIQLIEFLYTFWHNQNSWKISFALKSVSTIQAQALEYPLALSPLVLILIMCIVLRSGIIQRCRNRFNLRWDPLSSLIHAYATYTTLLYTNIMTVSFNLFASSKVFNQTSELPYRVMPYDASICFLSHRHIPYAVLALSMLSIFCILPLLLLLVYPLNSFQNLLNTRLLQRVNWLPLRIFSDSFMGCYRDKTEPDNCERRYFAGLYFLLRIVYISIFFFMKYSYVMLFLTILPFIVSFVFLVARPYKKSWLNIVDSAFFLHLGALTTALTFHIFVFPLPEWVFIVLVLVPPLYFAVLVVYTVCVGMRKCCRKCQGTKRNSNDNNDEESDGFIHERPHVLSQHSEASPLLVNPVRS